MDSITVASVKQAARQAMHVASDKLKLAEAVVGSSEYQDLDVAIIKATSSATHVAPKEKHVATLKYAVGPQAPRAQVAYVCRELRARLRSATDWLTALKTLMVFHRLIRECDASLLDELLKLGTAASVAAGNNGAASPPPASTSRPSAKNAPRLSLDGWVDTTTMGQSRFDFSSYVRALARYLDEQLDVYERINYLIESDRGGDVGGGNASGGSPASAAAAAFGGGGRGSRFRALGAGDLLFQLPRVQALLLRLADCAPAGAAAADAVVAASLAPVVKESFRGYRAASEGVINLADSLFEMTAGAASQALDAYRAALLLTSKLQAFYRAAEGVVGLRGAVQFPRLEPPPADFVGQIEEYVASVSGGGVGGSGGGVPPAVAVAAPSATAAAPATAAPFVPLRRGRFMSSTAAAAPLPPPPLSSTAAAAPSSSSVGVVTAPPSPSAAAVAAAAAASPRQNHDPGMVLASSSSASSGAAAAPAPAAAAPAVDLLGDLLSPAPVATAAAAAAREAPAASSAPFDPFAPVEAALSQAPVAAAAPPSSGSFFAANGHGGNGGSSSPPPAPRAAAAAAPPSFAPGVTGLLGSNPFGAAAPAEFTPAAAAAPVVAAPVVVAAAGPVVPAVAPAATPAAAAAAPPPPPPAASDPFAGLGGLTLGPGPKMTPPLKAMAPDRGRPMSSEKGGSGGGGGGGGGKMNDDVF